MVFFLRRFFRPALAGAVLLLAILTIATPAAAERVHVVGPGHTLGKIAKRYHTTVEALCAANKIRRRDPLKLGQRVIIPEPEATKKEDDKPPARQAPSKQRGTDTDADEDNGFTTHVVASGHTLGKIARRYRTSVSAIRDANHIQPREALKVGSCLVVPLTRRSSERQRSRRLPCTPDNGELKQVDAERRPSNAYARKPKRSGVVHMVRGGRTFRGRILDGRGRPISSAVEKVDGLLFDQRTAKTHTTDPGLLERIVRVSDHFGGRRIIVVSGYREESSNHYTTRSNHTLGRALDFRIEDVPNEALRDYCQTLASSGVGYYPNSSFVHLDVRQIATHWTDVSGPGEAPRYTSVRAPKQDPPKK